MGVACELVYFLVTVLPASMSLEDHKALVMSLLEERQRLERQLQILKLQEQHGPPKDMQPLGPSPNSASSSSLTDKIRPTQKPVTLRLALRKRWVCHVGVVQVGVVWGLACSVCMQDRTEPTQRH